MLSDKNTRIHFNCIVAALGWSLESYTMVATHNASVTSTGWLFTD